MAPARPRPLRLLVLLALAATLLPAAEAVAADRDRDRMNDTWERRYKLSTRVNDARRDPDRDGLRNLSEYRKRTHPRRADTDRDGIRDGADPQPRRTGAHPSLLRGRGASLPSDAVAAARVRRSGWEPRPLNAAANARVPSARELSIFHAADDWGRCDNLRHRVTGAFRGTTDESIQWAAWKWGLDEDVLRAITTYESWWKQDAVGNAGTAYGLTQIRPRYHLGTAGIATASTAFNLDYFGAYMRYLYEGCATWFGRGYRGGDFWTSLRSWCSGEWGTGCAGYTDRVREHMVARTWRASFF